METFAAHSYFDSKLQPGDAVYDRSIATGLGKSWANRPFFN